MAKRPNKLGRIEGEPKVKRQLPWKTIGTLALGIALVLAGVTGTLKYQSTIEDIKSQGVSEYKTEDCKKFEDKEKKLTWLECNE